MFQIRVEFKKERKPLKPKANQVQYEDSLNHRKKRTKKVKRALMKHSNRLMGTLELDSEEKRAETRHYLATTVDFVNEMHFVCEHAYVLIGDRSLPRDTTNRIRQLINSIEINVWRVENLFESGSGPTSIGDLRQCRDKALRCVKLLRAIQLDTTLTKL